jgi:hypothetical protein
MHACMHTHAWQSNQSNRYAISLKKLITFTFDRIAMLCSPNHVATVKQHKEHLKTNLRRMDYREFMQQ